MANITIIHSQIPKPDVNSVIIDGLNIYPCAYKEYIVEYTKLFKLLYCISRRFAGATLHNKDPFLLSVHHVYLIQ